MRRAPAGLVPIVEGGQASAGGHDDAGRWLGAACQPGVLAAMKLARLQMPRELALPKAAGPAPLPRTRVQVLLGLLPFAVMGAVAALDILAGQAYGFLPLLSLGPALAAVSLRPTQTALMGGVAMILSQIVALYDGLFATPRGIVALATIAGVTVAGAVASAGRHRRERDLADVTAVAEAAQRVLLRPVPRQIGPVDVAVRYISASAAARIGGDLYEVIATPTAVRLIIADVQGKGLAAVQTAAAVIGAFREAAHSAADLTEIADRIELSLQRQAAAEEFVTAILAQIPQDGPMVEILNCGHPPPLLLDGRSGRFIEPPEIGLPLGLAQFATGPHKTGMTGVGPGERLLFYTDGISEARDKSGEFYPLNGCAALLAGPDLRAAVNRLGDDVIRHVGHRLQDDAAILLVGPRQEPGPDADGGPVPAIPQPAQEPQAEAERA